MQKYNIRTTALAFALPLFLWPVCARAQTAKAPYPVMAPLDQYLIPDEKAEIALARSSAPASISDAAEVMVLRRDGYATAVKGSNGFVCIVQRSWAKPTDDPEFWNPKSPRPALLQSGSLKDVSAHLSEENQICAGGKIESTDPRGYYARIGKERTTRAGTGGDVLYDGEAAVPE